MVMLWCILGMFVKSCKFLVNSISQLGIHSEVLTSRPLEYDMFLTKYFRIEYLFSLTFLLKIVKRFRIFLYLRRYINY